MIEVAIGLVGIAIVAIVWWQRRCRRHRGRAVAANLTVETVPRQTKEQEHG